MIALSEFHFLYPYWFLLLPVIGLLFWWLTKRNIKSHTWQHFIDERLRPFVISGQDSSGTAWLRYIMLLVSLIVVVALSGPSWQKRELPAFQKQQGLVVVLDLSQSMYAQDVKPDRLSRARFKLLDLLKIREEGQTGLVVFAGDAFAVSPLTDDVENIIEQVKNLSPGIMPSQGSSVATGIDEAVKLLQQAGYINGDILIFTDGVSSQVKSQQSASSANDLGYRVSVASVGTATGAPVPASQNAVYRDSQGAAILAKVDNVALGKVAGAGEGVFLSTSLGDQDIERFQSFFQRDNSEVLKDKKRVVEHWQNEGIWLLWGILPFALLLFRKGYLFSIACVGLVVTTLMPQPANAFTWDELWLNKDQLAHKALMAEDAEKAKSLFESQDWKASAAYRNGDFEESAQLFDSANTAEGHYNRGTALAKAEKIEEAIKAYDAVLALQADHEDAKFNRDLLQKMKDQQDQKDQKDQKDQQGQQQKSEEQKAQEEKAKEDARKAEAEAAQQSEKDKPDESKEEGEKQEGKAESPKELSKEEKEQAEKTKQWLYQIPDDSAGLWRRKFQYQYQQRQPAGQAQETQPW